MSYKFASLYSSFVKLFTFVQQYLTKKEITQTLNFLQTQVLNCYLPWYFFKKSMDEKFNHLTLKLNCFYV